MRMARISQSKDERKAHMKIKVYSRCQEHTHIAKVADSCKFLFEGKNNNRGRSLMAFSEIDYGC